LAIPDYQRPYSWSIRNVDELVRDIWAFREKSSYRVGTIITHRPPGTVPEGSADIVDGQQRFFTFALLAIALCESPEIVHSSSSTFPDLDRLRSIDVPQHGRRRSVANLAANFAHLREMLGTWSKDDRQELLDTLLGKCEVVIMTLDDLDAAFQMFDSQNTRGKELYTTDLLKAFHLREMRTLPGMINMRDEMVRLWEEMPAASVSMLFNDVLFKIKRWSNGRDVPEKGFTSGNVDIFKGIREEGGTQVGAPWSLPYLYAKNFTDSYRASNDTLLRYGVIRSIDFPFQVDQPIINGETFFQMTSHYYRLGRAVGFFDDAHRSEGPVGEIRLPANVISVLDALNSHMARFSGDRRFAFVLDLIRCLTFYYVDRFGGELLDRAVTLFVRYAMALRVEMRTLKRATVNNYALGITDRGNLPAVNLFSELRQSIDPADFVRIVRVSSPASFERYEDLHYFFERSWNIMDQVAEGA